MKAEQDNSVCGIISNIQNAAVIDFEKPDSIPDEVETLINLFLDQLSEQAVDEICNDKAGADLNNSEAAEKYLSEKAAYNFYQELGQILTKYNVILYHATRILNISDAKKEGLKVLNREWYIPMLVGILKNKGVSDGDLNQAIFLIEQEFKNKLPYICGFSIIEGAQVEGYAEYAQFCESFGGEIARWALEEKMPNVYKILKENGKPVIIKFIAPLRTICSIHMDKVAWQLICYCTVKRYFNCNYTMAFDAAFTESIPGENILDVIQYRYA